MIDETRPPGPYPCTTCQRLSNRRVFLSSDTYYPNTIHGPTVNHSDDAELESFCSIQCLVEHLTHQGWCEVG